METSNGLNQTRHAKLLGFKADELSRLPSEESFGKGDDSQRWLELLESVSL